MNDLIEPMKFGGVVLCGGRSTRMKRPKALLPFGPEVMLTRVVRILQEVVTPIVVVAAPGQVLPELPQDVLVARDEHEALGPLAGIAAGLAALSGKVEAAYLTSCDAPFLKAAFVRRMIGLLEDHDLAISRDGEFFHPLAGAYRVSAHQAARELVTAGRLRVIFLLEVLRARVVDFSDLREVDPDLGSLRNVNSPEEYLAALRDAGLAS